MRKALRIALGVPQCTKNELVHILSDTMPLNYRVRQAAFIYHNKVLHFGSQHPLYKAISKVGNFPIMKPKRTKPQNRPGKIVNKRQTWAAVMIDLRKNFKLEIPAYDKPVTYFFFFFFYLNDISPGSSHLNPVWCEFTYWWLTDICSPHHRPLNFENSVLLF